MLKDNIRNRRIRVKLTQGELGKRIGVGKSSISMYESGDRIPPIDVIEKLSHVFNCDINDLIGEAKPSHIKIPVLGYVAAGIPIEAITDILDYEEISPELVRDGSEYFALAIKGDSMEPKMSDGDVVIVRKQPDVDSGQIGIVCINGDRATCKRVMKQDGGILLQPLNPSFAPVFYTIEQIETLPVTILGRVVELRAKF